MLTETGLFWLGAILFSMAGGSITGSIQLLRRYRSAPKPEDEVTSAVAWFLLGMLFAVCALWAWNQTAVATYIN